MVELIDLLLKENASSLQEFLRQSIHSFIDE